MKRYPKKNTSGIYSQIIYILICGALLLSFEEFSQEYEIKGKVVDEDGKPVPGVNVLIKGTSNGTAVNKDGDFLIYAPVGESTLFFSYIGYKSIEQKITVEKGYLYDLKVNMVKGTFSFARGKNSVEIIKRPLKSTL